MLYTERDAINDKLKLEIGEAVEKWVNSLVDYHLQNLGISDDSIIDKAATVKEGLRSHSAVLVANMVCGLDEKWKPIEAEMVQLLRASATAEEAISSILKPKN